MSMRSTKHAKEKNTINGIEGEQQPCVQEQKHNVLHSYFRVAGAPLRCQRHPHVRAATRHRRSPVVKHVFCPTYDYTVSADKLEACAIVWAQVLYCTTILLKSFTAYDNPRPSHVSSCASRAS